MGSVGERALEALQRLSTDDPTPDDVDRLAQQTRVLVGQTLAQGTRERHWLGFSLGAGNTIVKVGQYAGGGGALVFGLNAASEDGNKAAGRNAALSGAVAAGVTVLEQLFGLEKKRERAAACTDLRVRELDFQSRTRVWEYRHGDAAFRKELPKLHKELVDEVQTLFGKCVAK
jgi:hypothetical protein